MLKRALSFFPPSLLTFDSLANKVRVKSVRCSVDQRIKHDFLFMGCICFSGPLPYGAASTFKVHDLLQFCPFAFAVLLGHLS